MENSTAVRGLNCKVYPKGSLGNYKYVVICARYRDKWLMSRHKNRNTFETQGGHVETGEAVSDAAARELYEESGVRDAELYYVCDYCGYTESAHSNGAVFLAVVNSLGRLPESEMAETALFSRLPPNLTYPNLSPVLYREAEKLLHSITHDRKNED